MGDILDGPLGGPVLSDYQRGYKEGSEATLRAIIASNAGKSYFHLSYNKGKQVQEILNRYVNEELRSQQDHVSDEHLWSDGSAEELRRDLQKDINYIEELARLFD